MATKPKVIKAKTSKERHWFYSKSPAQRKEYIAKHPNSIYAKKAAGKDPAKAAPKMSPGRKAKIEEELKQLGSQYSDASNRYGWELDQGNDDAADHWHGVCEDLANKIHKLRAKLGFHNKII